MTTRKAPTPGRLLGALRYGPSSSSGPDSAAKYLEMTPGELAGLGCFEYAQNAEVIVAAKSRFSAAQLAALQQRAGECTGSKDPRLLVTEGLEGVQEAGGVGGALGEALTGALGDEGLLGGVADVLGNLVLAAAGVGLVVLGVTRVFGVTPRTALRGA